MAGEHTGEVMICRGGPRHRRVYYEADWQTQLRLEAAAGRPIPYEDTGTYVPIGKVYEYLPSSSALRDRPARVWQYTRDDVDKLATRGNSGRHGTRRP